MIFQLKMISIAYKKTQKPSQNKAILNFSKKMKILTLTKIKTKKINLLAKEI